MSALPLKDITSQGLRARLALPATIQNAGVLLLPSAQGLGATVNRILTELADSGLAALAWDPYSAYDAGLSQEQKSKITETIQQDTTVLREQSHLLDYLQDELGVAKIASLGFCMGGRMSLHIAAMDPRITAAVAFYPTLRDPRPENMIDPVPLANRIVCPVLVHYAGKDHLTSHASFARLRAALEDRSGPAPTTVSFHPHAHHGFMNQADQSDGADAAASSIAWPPTVAFLRTLLMQQASDA